MKRISFLIAIFPLVAAANECPSPQQLSSRIKYCSQNNLALEQAKICAESVRERWRKASEATRKRLDEIGAQMKSAQEHSQTTGRSSYQQVLNDLYREITAMQRDTDYIAKYGNVMMDFADVSEDEPSALCFTENFEPLQPIVSSLDKEIVQAKAVYEEARALRNRTAQNEKQIDSSSVPGSGPLLKGKAPKAPAPALKGKDQKYIESDVSGIAEDEAKRAKAKQK